MKNILLFISLSLMFLLGARAMNVTLPEEEGVGMESVLQADASVGYILPVVAEWPEEGDAYVDAESLMHQFRVCGRSQRQLSVRQFSLARSSAHRLLQKRLELLFNSIERTYSSLPCQSWSVPSDHYVFGMRRILI